VGGNIVNDKKLKRVVIKEELVALTGDIYKAIILNQFIYWSERIADVDKFIEEESKRLLVEKGIESTIEKQHGWIYKKAEELSRETMLGLAPSNIRKHIQALVDNGWLDQRRNPKYKWDKTYQYRPNIVKIQKDLHLLGYSLEGYPLQLDNEILDKLCNIDNSRISVLEIGNCETEIHNQQNEKAIPEINKKITSKDKRYIGDGQTNVLNTVENSSSLDKEKEILTIDKEALEFYKLLPRQDGDIVEFILEYRKLRSKYSKEYLELIIDRYKKSKELKGENVYHRPENFFKYGEYKKYLDENWDSTLEECRKMAQNKHFNRSSNKIGSNEPQVTDEWDKQLKDLGW